MAKKSPTKKAPAVKESSAPPSALKIVLQPTARDRWMSASVRNLTPDRIEQIMRSALLSGNFVHQWELFDLMEDTWPRLKKNLNELKGLCEAAKLVPTAFLSAKKPSALAEKKKDFLAAAFGYSHADPALEESGWSSAIYDICDAIGKGISVLEILWETRVLTGDISGPAIMPRAFQWITPRHYGYWVQEPQLKLSVTGIGSDYIDFPPDKFIIAKYKTKTGHTLTAALLRSLATIWLGANFSYDWALNLAQMFGLPIRWATYDPSNPKLLDDITNMLENMGSAGWGAFPAGTTLELKEAVKDATHNPQHFLMQLADISADILILGQTLTTEQGRSGSQALGRVHQDVRADVIKRVANWIGRTLGEQFVAPLMRLNFGNNDEDPTIAVEIEGAEQKDELEMAQRDKILIGDLQIPVSRPWLYDRYDIPMPEDGDDIFIAPQPKAPGPAGAGAESDSTAARFIQAKSANDAAGYEIGDRVKPKPGKEHGKMAMGDGTVKEIDSPALGILFDGMKEIHHWYVADELDPADAETEGRQSKKMKMAAKLSAPSATDKLVDHMLEDLTGVDAKWLGGVKPFFAQLLDYAKNDNVTDAELMATIEAAANTMPELFAKLNTGELSAALERGIASSLINGVTRAVRDRKVAA